MMEQVDGCGEASFTIERLSRWGTQWRTSWDQVFKFRSLIPTISPSQLGTGHPNWGTASENDTNARANDGVDVPNEG